MGYVRSKNQGNQLTHNGLWCPKIGYFQADSLGKQTCQTDVWKKAHS